MTETAPILRVLFICRGSVKDGLGHVMRSRTVALEMSRRAAVKMIVVGDRYVNALLQNRGLNYRIVPDEQRISSMLREFEPHVVFFDLMYFPERTFRTVREQAITVSLSPIFNCLEKVNLLFHRTIYHSLEWKFEEHKPILRCGLEYAVVREDCVRIPEETYLHNLNEDPFSVVISMGGSDASNKTLQVLEVLKTVPRPMIFWALLGEGYAHSYQSLVECIQRNSCHEIILVKSNSSIWRIMSMCSLAILAGGTITYEAAYAGIPSINIFEVREHVFLLKELVDKEICINAGYPFLDALSVVRANVVHLERHRKELIEMHSRCKDIIDGLGVTRIVEETQSFYRKEAGNLHPEMHAARRLSTA